MEELTVLMVLWCFNPCFNGYYTSTIFRTSNRDEIWKEVSILVLMDITLLL